MRSSISSGREVPSSGSRQQLCSPARPASHFVRRIAYGQPASVAALPPLTGCLVPQAPPQRSLPQNAQGTSACGYWIPQQGPPCAPPGPSPLLPSLCCFAPPARRAAPALWWCPCCVPCIAWAARRLSGLHLVAPSVPFAPRHSKLSFDFCRRRAEERGPPPCAAGRAQASDRRHAPKREDPPPLACSGVGFATSDTPPSPGRALALGRSGRTPMLLF
jgi:hypothetical protein